MFERFKRSRTRDDTTDPRYDQGAEFQGGNGFSGDRAATGSQAGQADRTGTSTAVADDRTAADDRTTAGDRTATDDRTVADRRTDTRATGTRAVPAAAAGGTAASYADTRAAQRERFGGADGTAIFFGWLSALGLAALILAVVGAAGTRLGFAANVSSQDAKSNAGTIGIVGAAILVVVLLLAYYCGGYVAGRMARFDGGKQGFRVWLLGLLVTIAAAVAGWIGGSQYNVYQQLNLPRIPVSEGAIATGAVITLVVVLVGTLLAAVAGGKAGDRYHARIDATAWDRDRA